MATARLIPESIRWWPRPGVFRRLEIGRKEGVTPQETTRRLGSRALLLILGAAFIALGTAGVAHARSILYGAAHIGNSGPSTLYIIDPSSGATTPVGAIGFNRVSGMDFDASGRLFATGERTTGPRTTVLLTIDPSTGVGTEVGVIPPHSFGLPGQGSAISDIAFRHSDGALFAYLEPRDGLGTINPATGALTELGATGLSGNGNGLAFSANDTLFKLDDLGLFTLDQTTAVGSPFATSFYPTPAMIPTLGTDPRVNAMKFEPETGALYASLLGGFGPPTNNFLAIVSTATGTMAVIGPTVTGLDALAWSPPVAAADHFQCYSAKREHEDDKIVGPDVTLQDQFGTTVKTVKKPKLLCAPVSKNGEGITNPDNHLVCYQIKKSSRAPGDKFEPLDVQVDNQFGKQILTVKKSKLLCVPSAKTVLGPARDHKDDDEDDDDDHDDDHGPKKDKGHR